MKKEVKMIESRKNKSTKGEIDLESGQGNGGSLSKKNTTNVKVQAFP